MLSATALFLLLAAIRYFTVSFGDQGGFTVTTSRNAPAQEMSWQVDINAADREELRQIPGIGAALAARIIAYREENGPFQSVEELVNVNGIGERTLEAIRPYVTIGSEP